MFSVEEDVTVRWWIWNACEYIIIPGDEGAGGRF